jgi:hypothetical protein
MVMPGKKPSDGPTVTRHKPTVDWVDVIDVPYTGDCPELPDVRTVATSQGDLYQVPIPDGTYVWWRSLRRMPHCVLWQDSDWSYALDTAMVHAQASLGQIGAMAELRMREKTLGTTVDARRDLRLRYVEPIVEAVVLAPVADISDRRKRLLDS